MPKRLWSEADFQRALAAYLAGVTTTSKMRASFGVPGASFAIECQRCGIQLRGIGTHGHTARSAGQRGTTPEYRSWMGMIQRCTNPRAEKFPNYGGRGIVVCDQWRGREGFLNFLADMGPRPPGTSIDRIDNDGNYEPVNCRWATVTEQANHRSNNRVIEYLGEHLTLAAWARRLGMPGSRLQSRVDRGWPLHLAMDPSASRRDVLAWRGKLKPPPVRAARARGVWF